MSLAIHSSIPRTARLIVSAGLVLLASVPAYADKYQAPRTSDGQPDLQGYWRQLCVAGNSGGSARNRKEVTIRPHEIGL